MKKQITLSITAILTALTIILISPLQMLSINVSAETTYKDGYYTYTVTDGKATITDCDTSISGDVIIPETLGNYPVTKIGEHAFISCSSITSINIPDGVKIIDYGAFSICSSLTSVTIPASVTNIGPTAFSNCKNLNDVYISDIAAWCNIVFGWGVSNPFYYAKKFYLNGELITDLVIPNGVTNIKKRAFDNCTTLTSVTIPGSVTSIGEDAFYGCTLLKKTYVTDLSAWCNIDFVNVSSNPMSCGGKLYLNGEMVTDLIIPNDIKAIKKYAFSYCKIESLTIPDNIEEIGDFVFQGCTVNKVYITDVAAWCRINFNNAYSNPLYPNWGDLYLNGERIKSLVIPDGVTSISAMAFVHCSSITSVTIPDSLKSIGGSAFKDCVFLEAVYISDMDAWHKITFGSYYADPMYYAGNLYLNGKLVTELRVPDMQIITESQYYNYNCIEDVFLPKNLTAIRQGAFYNCSNIKNVYFGGTSKEWAEIEIYFGNEWLNRADIYYNCTAVPKEIISIGITALPKRLEYVEKREPNLAGGILTVSYDGGATREISLTALATNIQGYDMNKIGSQILTVNYEGYTDNFEVTVFKNGDLDGDGSLNAKDLTKLRTVLFDKPENIERYDIKYDNALDIKDLVHLKKKIAGIID